MIYPAVSIVSPLSLVALEMLTSVLCLFRIARVDGLFMHLPGLLHKLILKLKTYALMDGIGVILGAMKESRLSGLRSMIEMIRLVNSFFHAFIITSRDVSNM
jgi:hypothetical protein